MSGNSQQTNRKSSAATGTTSNKYASISMTGQITTDEEELEERVYNKIVAKIQDKFNLGSVDESSQSKRTDEQVETMRLSTHSNANATWSCIGSGAASANAPSCDDEKSTFKLSEDLYSILSTASWKSIPFWISILVIVGFQYVLAILLLANQVDIKSEDNPLNLPANVEISVHISQAMLIIIALFSQRDLLDGIESLVRGFPDHFCGHSRFANMTRLQWRLSAIVRLVQGLLNFLASFVLALQAETVLDLVLNVMGVAFISDLDELSFRLSKKGYFGGSMKRISEDVCDVRFHRTTTNIGMTTPTVKNKIKKDAHIISAFAAFLTGLVVFSYLAIEQNNGTYLEQQVRIEFGDEVLPFLGLFNGCYRKSDSGMDNAGRLVYEQVGYPNGGKFGFCADFEEGGGGWTFYIGDQLDDISICEKKNYILRSGDTSTFSLLDAGETKWYTYDDLPMDYLEITESTECGKSMLEATKDACPSISAFDTMPMAKLSSSTSVIVESLDASITRPIYWSNSSENGSYTLIFFAGRRWIRTNSNDIQGLGNETSVKEIEDFFFSGTSTGLFKFIDQLRTSVNEEVVLVSAVSESVDTVRDQGSPLGLLWYLPRYEDKVDNVTETETDKLQRNFPSANLARPIDSVWTCLVCNDETNPCLNEGICDTDKGTCDCQHGETGELCQILPLGNGICNLYYNKEEHNYDGGDCCSGTCMGSSCGSDDLPGDPFLSSTPHGLGYYHFSNKTEEWKKTFHEREFAYRVDISEENLQFSGPRPLRFSHCVDPETALLTIEQNFIFPPPDEDTEVWFASTTVRCDGALYLKTPLFGTTFNSRWNHTFKEEVRVPYGKRCEFIFGMSNVGHINLISIFTENKSEPFLQRVVGAPDGASSSDRFDLWIPSACVWDTFVENLIPPMNDLEYEEFTRGVDLDAMCNRDRGEVLERYAVWKIAQSLTDNGDMSQNFFGHVCDLKWTSWLTFFCDDSRRLSLLSLRVNKFPSEIGSLTLLTTLDVSNDNTGLMTTLPTEIGRLKLLKHLTLRESNLTSLPAEIGGLASITKLDLDDNQLTFIPPEIGRLTSLATIELRANQLKRIPSEIGSLTSLTSLDLRNNQLTSIPSEIGNLSGILRVLNLFYNPMTWDSLPIEVQDLESEGTNIQVCRDSPNDGCLE